MTRYPFVLGMIFNLMTAVFYSVRLFAAPTTFLAFACVAFALLAGFNVYACLRAGTK